MIIQPHLCPHKQNPKACLTCYHKANADRPRYKERGMPDPISSQSRIVAPEHMQRAIDRSIQGVQGEKIMREVERGEQATPPVAREQKQAPKAVAASTGGSMQPAFSYAQQAWGRNEKGIEVPPERRSLIDALPKHPHLGQSKML